MAEVKKSQCEGIALQQSLVCATFGLSASLLLIALIFGLAGVRDVFDSSTKMLASMLVAVAALYVAAACLGMVAGDLICRVGLQDPRIWVIGVGLAWGCLLISVLAGSSIHFFAGMGNPPDVAKAFGDYILKPVFWVMLFGTVPALGLGLLYASRVKKSLSVR
jgi:hypothetical protein